MTPQLIAKGLTIVNQAGSTIISSVDADGFPNTKAMLPPREHDGLRTFYFTTNTSSMRVGHFKANPKSSLYFFDSMAYRGLMLIGTMEVREDQETKQRIWREGDTLYYPGGVTDSDYCVLKFTARSGRLYENFGSSDLHHLSGDTP